MRRVGWWLAFAFGIALPSFAAPDDLGTLEFANSGAEAAQGAFVRGVLLLHSFEFVDAREAFLEAQSIDPAFVMARWGEAMTHNHPLWRQQDREAGRAALAKIEPAMLESVTARERAFVGAVEVLYGTGSKEERDEAYLGAMASLADEYPEDLEARAFHALAILGSTQGRRDFRVYMRAAAVAEEVYAENPKHPGALHYLIHSYDDPVHAPLGLRAARVYADVAPAASHAQHMISHIYVALGQWRESVDANRKAYRVSVERAVAKDLAVDARNYHAHHWLEYSYLQLGQLERARRLLDEMWSMADSSRTARAHTYWAAQRASWLVDSGATELPPSLEPGDDAFGAQVLDAFGTGFGSLRTGEREAAEAALHVLAELVRGAGTSPGGSETDVYASLSDDDVVVAKVMAKELEAMLAMADGYPAGARQAMDEAVALERARPLEYGPPAIPKPSPELYGEMLLHLGESEAAIEMFELALERAPRRPASLAGLATAAARLGSTRTLATACQELESIWSAADSVVAKPEACDA